MEIGFPARGRTILADELETILFSILPQICRTRSICGSWMSGNGTANWAGSGAGSHSKTDEREGTHRLFGGRFHLAQGKRRVGTSHETGGTFFLPESMRVSMELPGGKTITGMGIPQGITVITGGGYHGKSTLLKALEKGVYDHIPGRWKRICFD